MNRLLIIALGAAAGANARYFVGLWAADRFGADFPYGTFIVNIAGSFLLGFLITITTQRVAVSSETRLLLVVGFLGSFTTFSSYTVESLLLIQDGGLPSGLLNIVGNNLLGLSAAFLGIYLARLAGS